MKNRLLKTALLLLMAHSAIYAVTYSCSAVLANKYYVNPGENVVVNAQVDCYFLSGFGSTFGPQEPVTIALAPKDIQTIPPFTKDEAFELTQLSYYPKENELFAFEFKPIKGQLAGQPIQVVVRTEPITDTFKTILQQQLQTAQKQNDVQTVADIRDILNNIDTKSMVQIYRRLPSIGETKFKPMHTQIFVGAPEQQIADIRLLPTGNLQIVEHTPEGKKLVEEAFGNLK